MASSLVLVWCNLHFLYFYSTDKDVVSSLPLQMSLYFNMWFFPFWWISEVVMLQLKVILLYLYFNNSVWHH